MDTNIKKTLSLVFLCLSIFICLLQSPVAASDFRVENGVLTKYSGSGGNIKIPAGVTAVGASAFKGSSITSVAFPDSITVIQAQAFMNCTSLKSSTSYKSNANGFIIDNGELLSYTGSDTDVTIPNGVTSVASTAFIGKNVSNVTIPESVTKIADDAIPAAASVTAADGSYAAQWAQKTGHTLIVTTPLAKAVSIMDASGKDITGKTATTKSKTYKLKAAATPSTAAQKFTWKSSDKNTATVDANGNVTFKKGGTVTITASATDGSGKSASVTLKTDIKATKVVVKDSSGKNITGKTTKVTKKTYQLKAAVEPDGFASQDVTWKSSNTKIATVSKTGKVTFKRAGKVKITATAADGSGVSASATLKTAIKAKKVTIRNEKGKAISHKSLKIKTKTIKINAVAIPARYAAQKFTWKTSDKSIATVKKGKVTFKKAGTVKITATARDGSKKSNWVKITYKPSSGKSVEPEIIETPIVVIENGSEWPELIVIEEPELKDITPPTFGNK